MENPNGTTEAVKPDTGGEGTTRPEGTEAPEAASLSDQPTDPSGSEGVRPAQSAKIKFTSKIRRGLALIRMVNITALDETGDMGTPSSPQRIIKAMTKKQEEEYNAALDWIDQEEDWDAVAKVWTEAGGR